MNRFLVSCIVFCSVFLTSCIGPKGEQGEPGIQGPGTNWRIVNVTVKATEWEYGVATETENPDEQYNNHYFFHRVDVPELKILVYDESGEGFVYDKGNVQGYVIYNYDKPNERQHVLPYTRHYEKCVDEANNQWEFYNETVDFVFGLDWVEFQFRASDFKYEDDETYNPGECQFRLVLTW